MTSADDTLWDRSGDDPEVARLEGLLADFRHDAPLAPLAPRRRRRRGPWLAIGAVVAVAAAAATALIVRERRAAAPTVAAGCTDAGGQGFRFAVDRGGARCGGAAAAAGVLPVGAWLETAVDGEARVRIADIGDVTLLGGSRLRAVATGPAEHRLELGRGRLRARVTAPPRLFVIDTPAATAVDLGCAYELEVDDAGQTRLRVTSGVVSLEGRGRAAFVPAGAEVATVDGGPGTPVRWQSPPALRDAVARFDRGARAAVAEIVATADECETLTLWNLLPRVDGADRRAVLDRLDALVIRPEWVLTDRVLAGDADALEAWRRDLEGQWLVGLSPTATRCFAAASGADDEAPGPARPGSSKASSEVPDEVRRMVQDEVPSKVQDEDPSKVQDEVPGKVQDEVPSKVPAPTAPEPTTWAPAPGAP